MKTSEMKAKTKIRSALDSLTFAEKVRVLADGLNYAGLPLFSYELLEELVSAKGE